MPTVGYTSVYYSNDGGNGYCWIGLYMSEMDNSYNWLDGNPSTYRNWDDGEPGNVRSQCVSINNGKFDDIDCTRYVYLYHYVCKGIHLF